jgi:hypothetical protein
MFLSSKLPQLSIGVKYVSIRARKQNFQQTFFCGPEFASKPKRCHANTKIKTVQPNRLWSRVDGARGGLCTKMRLPHVEA